MSALELIMKPNGETIKPQITSEIAQQLVENIYGLQVTDVKELNSYDDKNYHVCASKSKNLNIQIVCPEGYVLKIVNSIDSRNPSFVDAQSKALLHLNVVGIAVPKGVKNIKGSYFSLERIETKDGSWKSHIVVLLEYQPGIIFRCAPLNLQLFREAGVSLGKLNAALKSFDHPVFVDHTTIWHLKSLPFLKSYFYVVEDPFRLSIVSEIVESFIHNVIQNIDQLEKGIIHGDFNESNILVQLMENGEHQISAILDFGDVNKSCYLFEIGAALCYMMLEARRVNLDPIECGGATLKGYQSVRSLSTLECSLLRVTICARLCQSLVLGMYSQNIQPDNLYVGDTQKNGWTLLLDLWKLSDDELLAAWK